MIQVGTVLKVVDKTGVILVRCIKVLGPYKKRIGKIGDLILTSILHINVKMLKKLKAHKRRRFLRGKMHLALIVRTKVNYKRANNAFIKFNENSVVLVNKRKIPMSNRVYGPILFELCKKIPSLGCVSNRII